MNFLKEVQRWHAKTLTGDFEQSKELIEQIFHQYLIDEVYSNDEIRYRMNRIVSEIMIIITDLDLPIETGYTALITRLLGCKSVLDLHIYTISVINHLQEESAKLSRENSLYKMVTDYVNANYQDVNLNVSMIAENHKINISVLSSQFKKSAGISPLEYLQMIRIEKAKELLAKTGMTNKKILEMVGFTNEVSFIRVFKKHVGVTPGQFKSQNSKI